MDPQSIIKKNDVEFQSHELRSLLSQFKCIVCMEIMDCVMESNCCQTLCCSICSTKCAKCPQCRESKVSNHLI